MRFESSGTRLRYTIERPSGTDIYTNITWMRIGPFRTYCDEIGVYRGPIYIKNWDHLGLIRIRMGGLSRTHYDEIGAVGESFKPDLDHLGRILIVIM